MLSIKPLKSSSDTTSYFYKQESYYTKNLSENRNESQWHGKLAEKLKLEGVIQKETFHQLLSGKLPNGPQLGILRDNKIQHRPGIDLTFSAPKSLSIIWQLGGDERLLHAHIEAVKKTADIIEKECASARAFKEGKNTIESTENLLFALFHHDTSRELDPNLHTHALAMNMTERQDGKIRALASQAKYYGSEKLGFNEQMFARERHFGGLYRFILAGLVTKFLYSQIFRHYNPCELINFSLFFVRFKHQNIFFKNFTF